MLKQLEKLRLWLKENWDNLVAPVAAVVLGVIALIGDVINPELSRIVLVVAIVLAFVLGVIALIGAVRERFIREWNLYVLPILGLLLMAYLFLNLDKIAPGEWAQIFLVSGLVVATGFYALVALRQARANAEQAAATRQQAEASVKMAKYMVKPRIIPYFRFTSDFDSGRRVQYEAGAHNDGDGPAYDIQFWIEYDEHSHKDTFGNSVSVLRGHQSIPFDMSKRGIEFPHTDKLQRRFLMIKYRDIDGEYEISLPFVLETKDNKPVACLESITKKLLRKIDQEDERP